jgi:hypothetical protein
MTEIVKSEDCGNSPKNIFAQEIVIAMVENDIDLLRDSVADDVSWKIVGEEEIQGRESFLDQVRSKNGNKVSKLEIFHVVTHGKAGAVNGTRSFGAGKIHEFCDVLEFTNTSGKRVASISSYIIETR